MRSAAILLVMMLAAAPVHAALDAEANKPYRLQVLLHVADNRALTPLFQNELERTLGDQLRQSFGKLAEVQVMWLRNHPLREAITARGLEQALDGWEQTDATQTHVVLLDLTGGQYRLQSRSYDGTTAQASPTVRRIATGDRALVPILAARLVEQGFAPVGTVTRVKRSGKDIDVQLTLKGGGLGVPLSRWVKTGDVFAVSRVIARGKDQRASRVPWALLEVREVQADGVCRCRYWRRFVQDDLRDVPGVLGYRALRLPTTREPVRLRVLDEETLQPLDGTEVQVLRPGSKEPIKVTTNRDGLAVTREPLAHLAIVYLKSAGATLPVALIPGQTAVCRVKVQGGSEALAALEYRREAWLRRVYSDVALVAQRTHELAKLVERSLPEAEAIAREGLKNFDEELGHLTSEYAELKQLAGEHKLPAARFDLHEGMQRLDELRKKREQLSDFVTRVEQAIKTKEENVQLSQQLERARLLEAQAEYDQAIAVYEKVVAARPNETKVRGQLDALKQAWALHGKEHAAARAFVYKLWPTLDVAGLKQNLPEARAVLKTLKEVGDRLTAEKMRQANAIHVAALQKETDRLKRNFSVDNASRAKAIAEVAAGLSQLHKEITAFLAAKE